MTSGESRGTPYMQPGHAFARSEVILNNSPLLTRLRARAHAYDEQLHTTAAARTRGQDETQHQVVQAHSALAAQLAELRAAMDAQSTLLERILEQQNASGSGSRSES